MDEDAPSPFFGVQAHRRSGGPPMASGVMPLRSGLAVVRGREQRYQLGWGHSRSHHQDIQLCRGMCDSQRQNEKNNL